MRFRSSLLGIFVFDPYWWLYPEVSDEFVRPLVTPPTGPSLSGGIQLDVEPRRALVYVDGVLAGTVDQFKGYYQHLETSAGFHVIDFLAPDYEPLTVGVTVVPNKTTTYRAMLNRAGGRLGPRVARADATRSFRVPARRRSSCTAIGPRWPSRRSSAVSGDISSVRISTAQELSIWTCADGGPKRSALAIAPRCRSDDFLKP